MDQEALGTEEGLGPGHNVLDGEMGTHLPHRKGHSSPTHFSALINCDHMARWIRIPLGIGVGLGPGDIVLDGDPAPPWKGAQQPHFSAHFALAWSPISSTAELLLFLQMIRYRESAGTGNTVDLPNQHSLVAVSKGSTSKTLFQQNPPVLNLRYWLTQVVRYNGRKTVVVL